MGSGIPEAARRLISDHIESVAQLEVLLLLRGDREREWTAHDIAASLRTAPELAEASLGRMSRAGLLGVEIDADGRPCFRYAPAVPATSAAVDQLAAAYATHKTAVIAFIFSGETDSIQGFADAFRLRGDA